MATIGRIQVSPGQTIASSSWGNPVWDQSMQCFTSTADRDAQYPTPHDGSTCYTADTQTFWQYRAGIGWKSPPRGFIGSIVGPASSVPAGGTTTVMTLAVSLVAGRKYRVNAYARGQQTTAGGLVIVAVSTVDLAFFRPVENTSGASNIGVGGGGVALLTPSTTGSRTLTMTASTSAGTYTVAANQCEMSVEDLGTP